MALASIADLDLPVVIRSPSGQDADARLRS